MLNIGYKFKTNNYGIAKVIHYKNSRKVTVKFLNTGHEDVFDSRNIRKGSIKDKLLITKSSIIIGKIYNSNSNGKFVVIKLINSREVIVRFLSTNSIITTTSGQIRSGQLTDRMQPTLYKIGFEGIGKYSYKKDKKAASMFFSMHGRCYQDDKPYSLYKKSTVSKEWHNFQNFCEWFYENYIEGYEIDKDIKIIGNREYSKYACEFIPHWLNSLFNDSAKSRTDLPMGVSKTKEGRYIGRCGVNGKTKYGNETNSIKEAEIEYLRMKIVYVQECMIRKDFPLKLKPHLNERISIMEDRIIHNFENH